MGKKGQGNRDRECKWCQPPSKTVLNPVHVKRGMLRTTNVTPAWKVERKREGGSGSHPEKMLLIGLRRCEGYWGGRKGGKVEGEERGREPPHCDLEWRLRTILSVYSSTSVMQHTCNPNFTDCHFFLKHLLGDFFFYMFAGSFLKPCSYCSLVILLTVKINNTAYGVWWVRNPTYMALGVKLCSISLWVYKNPI